MRPERRISDTRMTASGAADATSDAQLPFNSFRWSALATTVDSAAGASLSKAGVSRPAAGTIANVTV